MTRQRSSARRWTSVPPIVVAKLGARGALASDRDAVTTVADPGVPLAGGRRPGRCGRRVLCRVHRRPPRRRGPRDRPRAWQCVRRGGCRSPRRPDRPAGPCASSRPSSARVARTGRPTRSDDRSVRARASSSTPSIDAEPRARPDVAARSPSSARRAGSTSSASTPTTTRASCCRPRSTSRSGSPTCRPTTGGSSSTRLDDGERDGFDLDAARARSRRLARLRRGHGLGARRGRPAADRPARRHRVDPAAQRRPVVVGRDRARVGLGDARRRRPRRSTPFALARICQRAENGYVGVQSGLMDQFAESCGVAGSAVLLDCRSLDWRPIPLPGGRRRWSSATRARRGTSTAPPTTCGGASARRPSPRSRATRPGDPQPARRDARAARGGPATGSTRSHSGAPSTS